MKKYVLGMMFALVASTAFAQSARPTDKFQWEITAPSLETAQAYRWEVELDLSGTVQVLTATCQSTGGAAVFTCLAPIPPITPAQHTARVRAVDVTDGLPVEGPWSESLAFSMRATPNKPTNLTITRQ